MDGLHEVQLALAKNSMESYRYRQRMSLQCVVCTWRHTICVLTMMCGREQELPAREVTLALAVDGAQVVVIRAADPAQPAVCMAVSFARLIPRSVMGALC